MGNFSQEAASFNPINPSSQSSSQPNCTSPKQLGDAFLTIFSAKDLEALKNGETLDLKNGVLSNLNDLAKYDKNGDGKISGDELKDIQVSIDYNKDGKIDNNELKSAQDANIKEIDLNSKKVITNDGKDFDLKPDPNVNIGGENKPAVVIDTNEDGKPTKDGENKLQPGDFSQLGDKTPSGSSSGASSSSSSGSSSGASSSSSSGNSSRASGSSSSGNSSGGGK